MQDWNTNSPFYLIADRQANFPVAPWPNTATYSVSENGQLFIAAARYSHSPFCKIKTTEFKFCFWKIMPLVF